MAETTVVAGDTSVILTCYNEKNYILDAVRSVLKQTVVERIREIVVVDDGSTDGSADAIGDFADGEPKVVLVRSINTGLPSARNLALENTSGTYVAILDGDDLWTPDKLERQLPILDEYPSVGLVYSDYYEFDDGQLEKLEHCRARSYQAGHKGLLADYYLLDAPVIPSAMVIRRTVFDEIGLFNADFRIGEDTEFCLRIAERFEFHHVGQPLVKKRRHPNALTSRQDRLWPNHQLLTKVFADRNPELKCLTRKRLSRRAAKVGWGMIQVGDRKSALSYLSRSLRYDPFHLRAYVYGGLACVPKSAALRMHRLLSSLKAS